MDEVFHQDVTCVFGAGEAGFDQGETRLHEEYKHGGQQHPDSVYTSGHFGQRVCRSGCVRFLGKSCCTRQQ